VSRILIADDIEQNRDLLESLLRGHGHEVAMADNGADALARAREQVPDLVISDILMPVMDGFTLCAEWRADPALGKIPFIFYTATYTDPRDERLAYDVGADRFVVKPAPPDAFLATVEELLAQHAAGALEPSRAPRGDVRQRVLDHSAALVRKLEQKMVELERTQRALLESEERFRLLATATSDLIWDRDLARGEAWCSSGLADLFGHDPRDVDASDEGWFRRVHPDDRAEVRESLARALAGDAVSWSMEFRYQRADGSYARVLERARILRDEQGRAVRLVGGTSDLSERVALEERLRRSEQLEALGQLTGGVAHDFNNLLTVVLGHAELLADGLAQGSSERSLALGVIEAAQRGAALTRRLLAFGRRQVLDPQPLDVNERLAAMQVLLERTLGRDVDIQIAPGEGLWRARIDPAQLDNALLNLCVNARQAMPRGGHLTIETGNVTLDERYAASHGDVEAGDYVLVAVADSGTGIEPEILERVFEPFFTTKPAGEGTGLGLAMVYGFIKQSCGHVSIYSEPGRGTTVKMYLPRWQGEAGADPAAADAVRAAASGGTGTVLVVDDDAAVRAFASRTLGALGYRVLEAGGTHEALELLRSDAAVDLLFTDVVLAGPQDGTALAQAARALRPGLPVLFTSGYMGRAAVSGGILPEGSHLISKPYGREALARRVREAMDRT